ncbi:hypothetical protein KTD33_07790 [Burkholderia gladioli]|uniref:hypothetical protein n=1 Tax=Burkholderia gladioli TaxID=28095 RepID=UPI001C22BB18|nr:hypothetical protein [Burkholderia gladioli]MBU9194437.1 hypothetical protein [Burkholderia gladioli]
MKEPNQTKSPERKSDKPTCTLESNFSSLIQSAINLGSGYRQKSREIALVHYTAAHQYHFDEPNHETYEAELKALCAKNNVEVTPGKTSPYHMIVRLTFTDATKQYVSDKVHVLSVALAKQIKPETFLAWIEDERGERKIIETYKRDGSRKQEGVDDEDREQNSDGSYRERNRNEQIQRARQQLANSAVLKVDVATVSQALPKLEIDTECAAIIVRQVDGSIAIKAVVVDHDIADDVYAGYYRANSHEIDAAVQQRKIEEMLENTENLTLTDIRRELGDEIADKAAEAASGASAFNREMAVTPEGLKKYLKLLKKADLVYGTSGAVSYTSFYESALEELEQVLEGNQSLQACLDRPFDGTVNLCPENMPRPIGSKSKHAKISTLVTKQSALREILKSELAVLSGN